MIKDALLIKITREMEKRWIRKNYEGLLVEMGLYSLSTLKDNDEYNKLSNYDLILETLRAHAKYDAEILYEINDRRRFSEEILSALKAAGIELNEKSDSSEKEKYTQSNGNHTNIYQTENQKENENLGSNIISKGKENMTNEHPEVKAAIISSKSGVWIAIIGLLGGLLIAILTPFATKWANQPEPTPNPTDLAIEKIPLKLFTYQGDGDTTCTCVGVAHLEFRYDANLLPGYTLNYVFPDNNSNYGYAGLVFVFDDAQDLSNYSSVEFSIVFSDPNDQVNVDITDISELKVPYHIVDNGTRENKIVIPFSNYEDIEFKAVRSIGFSANTVFSFGNHKFTVNNIRFIK